MLSYTVVLERNETAGYTVRVPALQGCITEGDTIAEALAAAREAIEAYLESLSLDGESPPEDVPSVTISIGDTPEALLLRVRVEPERLSASAA